MDLRIGLIAGGGQFPLIFSESAKKKGFTIFAAAYIDEADPKLKEYVDEIEWFHLGQVRRLIRYFKLNQVSKAVMIGTIQKTRMFSDVKPDIKAISLILGMKHTHDDGVLRAFAGVLEKEGIKIHASTFLLPELMAPPGCWTKRKPNRSEMSDIELGWRCAKEIGRLDIGQCVVVGGGTVLAVEAIDGTDETIKRGAALGSGSAVVVKTCKPNQDIRFDMPAIGIDTIKTMNRAGATVLAVEAQNAVVFDREEMVDFANQVNIAIIAMDETGRAG